MSKPMVRSTSACSSTVATSSASAEKVTGTSSGCIGISRLSSALFSFSYMMRSWAACMSTITSPCWFWAST